MCTFERLLEHLGVCGSLWKPICTFGSLLERLGVCGSLWEQSIKFFLYRVVGESHLDTVIAREEIVVVLFIDESTPLLNVALKKAGRELELTFGLVVIDVTDIQGIQV